MAAIQSAYWNIDYRVKFCIFARNDILENEIYIQEFVGFVNSFWFFLSNHSIICIENFVSSVLRFFKKLVNSSQMRFFFQFFWYIEFKK